MLHRGMAARRLVSASVAAGPWSAILLALDTLLLALHPLLLPVDALLLTIHTLLLPVDIAFLPLDRALILTNGALIQTNVTLLLADNRRLTIARATDIAAGPRPLLPVALLRPRPVAANAPAIIDETAITGVIIAIRPAETRADIAERHRLIAERIAIIIVIGAELAAPVTAIAAAIAVTGRARAETERHCDQRDTINPCSSHVVTSNIARWRNASARDA